MAHRCLAQGCGFRALRADEDGTRSGSHSGVVAVKNEESFLSVHPVALVGIILHVAGETVSVPPVPGTGRTVRDCGKDARPNTRS